MAGCVRRDRQIVSSAQVDPGLTLVGGSPFPGDLSGPGILVPSAPTPNQSRRYLFRNFGVDLGVNQTVYIRSLRHYLWIGTNQTQFTGVVHFEQIVTTPGWRFPDANATFHLRKLGPGTNLKSFAPFVFGSPPGLAGTSNGLTPALLGTWTAVGGYLPFNGGMPYGDEIAGLGTIRDGRFNTVGPAPMGIDLKVVGPGSLVDYASVYQTNPTNRVNWAGSNAILDGLGPEDRFFVLFNLSRFWRVGAEATLDLCTWCPEGWCTDSNCQGYVNPDFECGHRPAGLGDVER